MRPTGTLVFHHNGIGDHVMNLPALRLLAQYAPRPVCIVAGDVPAAFLYQEPDVHSQILMHFSPGRYAHVFDPTSPRLSHRFEYFVSLATWDAPAIHTLKERSGARSTLGLFSGFSVRSEADDAHDIHRLVVLAMPFAPGARLEDSTAPCVFARDTQSLRATMVPRGRRLLVIHPDTRLEKMWLIERYDPLVRAFLDGAQHWHAAILNLPSARLPRAIQTRRLHSVTGATLAESMKLVPGADLFLGIDSRMLHVADLCRVPSVALFGATTARQFGFILGDNIYTHNLVARNLQALNVTPVLMSLQRGVAQVECRR
jgi:ADP-heptose:LPS heptosyltransferase